MDRTAQIVEAHLIDHNQNMLIMSILFFVMLFVFLMLSYVLYRRVRDSRKKAYQEYMNRTRGINA